MPASNRSLAVLISFCLVFGAATATSTARGVKGPPRLEQRGKAKQLVVDGDPFLVVGGELGNSTASDLEYLADALDRCASMNVNTVMLPVYWDLVEPVEGEFDFSLVEGAIDLARERDLKLVYLWFATWKNSMSAYAPTWVKRDTTRFPRIRQSNGEAAEIISPESISARDADARAFAQLMRWTKSYDAGRHTVVMAQVENEIGMIPDPRDHGAPSDAIFTHAVPDKLVRLAGNGDLGPEIERIWRENGGNRSGPWSRVFGDSPEGQEIFAAWRFASYVEHVAAAGKREYALPMFVNAALIRPGYRPGNYPSGGPLPHLIELWQATAPSLDMLSPDIYFPNFMDWASRYHRAGNPVFIPEMAPSMRASANAVFAVGALNAIGSGPFAIEDVRDDKAWLLRRCYRHLRNMSSLILDAQSDGRILGLAPEIGFDWTTSEDAATGSLGGVVFRAEFDRPSSGDDTASTLPTLGHGHWEAPPGAPLGSVMIIQLDDEEFVALGMGVRLTFAPADGDGTIGIESSREGRYENGEWHGERWLNGDQTHQGRHLHLYPGDWRVQRFRLYRY